MSNAFKTADMAAALAETVTNGKVVNEGGGKNEWGKAQPYNYESYQGDGEGAPDWESNARVYEWDGEEGEVGPHIPELEAELFGDPNKRGLSHGIDFSKISEISVIQEGPTRVVPIMNFKDAGLHPAMLDNIELAGYKVPTPIQKYCFPAIHLGHDIIAIAQTGSGKTAAYLVPILNKLMGKAKKLAAPRPNPAMYRPGIDGYVRAEPLVVIVCPARELAIQIFNEARKFCYRTMLRPCVTYGGGPIREQIAQLQKGCDILISSPGRLVDFITRPDVLSLRRLKYMVIDEADEMLQDDWQEEFNKILSGGEQEEGNVKYLLFSATFPKAARDLAKTHLAATHVRIRVGRAGSTHENITQNIVQVDGPEGKNSALVELLQSMPPCRTIIFVNSKRAADELDSFLYHLGMPCTSMHSDRTQREREDALRAFRAGKTPILIATGVSARGIDVRNVMHVVNYDLPSMMHGGIEEYTHRIGRTGRIGHKGVATSFYTDRDESIASVLTRTLLETNQEIPDFLKEFVPEGAASLKFEADSDFDEDEAAAGTSFGFGSSAAGPPADNNSWGATTDEKKPSADAWGAGSSSVKVADDGW